MKEILTTYWAQSVFIILGISYFVKRILDLKSKKVEIKFSLFQEHRIVAVNNFFTSYSKVEFMWHSVPHWKILQREITAEQIDDIVWPPLYSLKQSLFELKVYFPGVDHKKFEKLYENFLILNQNLLEANFEYSKSQNTTLKANSFVILRDATFKDNSQLIDELSGIIRDSYRRD